MELERQYLEKEKNLKEKYQLQIEEMEEVIKDLTDKNSQIEERMNSKLMEK